MAFLKRRSLCLGRVSHCAISSLSGKSLLSTDQLSKEQFQGLLKLSRDLKHSFLTKPELAASVRPLQGVSMSMIFQKRSTRTRVSTETGMYKLGAHALFLGPQDVQLGVNESLKDTAKVLSRFNDVILARVYAHADVQELAKEGDVPVINALSDKYHPLQTLADMMTLQEHFGNLSGRTLTWVGDGNNVLHDLMIGAILCGMNVRVATPSGYEADPTVIATARKLAEEHHVTLWIGASASEAVEGADVVVTDTWISMGQEEEAKRRIEAFAGYQVSAGLMSRALKNAVFLHCLPRHPEEVTDEVFYSQQSLVFPEAENRMWTVMAVTMQILNKTWPL